jgi:hypothetical protein
MRGYVKANAELPKTTSKTRYTTAGRGYKAKGPTAASSGAFEKAVGGDTLRVAGEIKGSTIYVITTLWVSR